MQEFQHKQKIAKRLYSKTSILILLVITFFLIKGIMGVYEKERGSRKEVELLEVKKHELAERLAHVEANTKLVKSEEGIESEIRSKFDVVKPGEGVIVVVDEKIPEPEEDRRGFLKKFWDSVTGVFKKDKTEPPKTSQ